MGLYLLLIFGTFALSLWAAARVKSVYHRYSQIPASSHATGAQIAAAILQRAGIRDVEIVAQEGMLGDHYDPMHKRLVLSVENYQSDSLAAIGVAAHECGHALKHQQAYAPLHWRMAAIGAANIGSQLCGWLPMIGMMTGLLSHYTGFLIMGIGWALIMGFNLVTLPVEFDASNRARRVLREMGFIGTDEEMAGVRKTLDAAGWTYVAAFVTSLAWTLYYLLPLLTGGSRSRE